MTSTPQTTRKAGPTTDPATEIAGPHPKGTSLITPQTSGTPRPAAGGRTRTARTGSGPNVAHLDDTRQLHAWACAVHHLAELGLTPIVPPHIARALRRRGMWPAALSFPDRPLSDSRHM